MKKAILLMTLAALFMIVLSGTAFAAPPSVIGSDGSSVWTYQDSHDASAKPEGGYAPFDSGTDYSDPHGGYDTTTNKCKVCHAVHRAEGAYYLLRADTQDDACDYCHIGASAHSNIAVYDALGNADGTNAPNGHTIGSSSVIPDSSVQQWTEDTTLTTTNASGTAISEVVQVRAYNPDRNQMFRFAKHHGHIAAGTGADGYMRIGPLALRCMSCHQQHGATNMVWKPTDMNNPSTHVADYQLLKLSPSGSIQGTGAGSEDYDAGMQNFTAYTGSTLVDADNVVKVPEETMTASNTGPGHTIYTTFTGTTASDPSRSPQTINQYALSAWCADCHNLDIGYWKGLTQPELGFRSHADRTHPAPYTGANNGPGQCYSCHRNDMPDEPTGSACETCHYGTGSYATNGPSATHNSDFPHSGGTTSSYESIKLLGPTLASMDSGGNRVTTSGGVDETHIDGVCLRCHTGIGTNH